MPTPYKNYNLGKAGVNVDKSPLDVTPEELLKAQNAIREPLGALGGLKNRPGLVKFNSGALAGSVLGGQGVPLIGFDLQRIYVAQQDGATEKWYSSNDLFATSTAETTMAAWQDPTEYFSTAAGASRMGAFYQGQLYYAAAGYTVDSESPPIRVWNGIDDRQISKLLPATTKGIISMVNSKGSLFVLTLDSGTTDADFVGRVFSIDEQGRLTKIGTDLATGYVPMSLAVHNDLIFVGTARLTTTNEARVYRINPLDETTWTLDNTFAADDNMITDLESFEGQLYATTRNGGAATKGKIVQRTVAGVWAAVDSTVNNGGSYESLAVIGGFLYATSRSYDAGANTAVIRRSSDGTTWATVYNSASTDGVGVLTIIGLRIFSMFGTKFLHSLNGTSYTSVTFPGANSVDGVIGPLTPRGDSQFNDPITGDNADATTETSGVTVSVINPASGGLGGNGLTGLYYVAREITLAEIRSLNTSPVTIVAGVAGKIIVPVLATFEQRMGSTTFSGSPTITISHEGNDAVGILISNFAISNAANRYLWKPQAGGGGNTANFEPAGVAARLRSSADVTLGSGTFNLTLLYYLATPVT